MQLCSCAVYLYLILFIIGSMTAHGEPEPVAKPTRPGLITNADDLKRYLELYTNYYKLKGKGRYGKRAEVPRSTSDNRYGWDTMKTMLDASERSQQLKFENGRREENRFVREYESFGGQKHAPRFSNRPYRMLDIVDKYYSDA